MPFEFLDLQQKRRLAASRIAEIIRKEEEKPLDLKGIQTAPNCPKGLTDDPIRINWRREIGGH